MEREDKERARERERSETRVTGKNKKQHVERKKFVVVLFLLVFS